MWELVQDGNVKCLINLSNVPKGKHNGKECNDWSISVKCKIGVRYQWLRDEMEERWFEIISYDKNLQKLILKWNDEIYKIRTGDLQNGKCGNIFDKTTLKFKYEAGQVINGQIIIEKYYKQDEKRIQRKWYKCQCEKGHLYEIVEGNLKQGRGCPYCSNKKVLEGFNDVATTNPDSVKYFSNPDEAKKYTAQSNKKVTLKCPLCGKEKTMRINTLINYGFSCPNCSDGVPLTEKFMSNLLFSKNIEFITQATKNNFDWIEDNSRYDFSLPLYKIIIEIDGDLRSHGDRTKDDYKSELALNNGWNVVRINLLEEKYTGSFEQLWNAYEQVLNNLGVHITEEEAKGCYIKSQTSICNLIAQITNDNTELNQQEIADKLKEKYGYQLHKSTVCSYLKKLNKLGLTSYKNKVKYKKQVICITTGEVFDCIKKASEKYKVADSNICNCCKGKNKYAGKRPETGEPLVWKYLDSE